MNERLTEMAELLVRALGPEDVEAYRRLRLLALATEPHGFGASYEEEAELGLDVFRARLTGDERVMFGAHIDGALVGIAGVTFGRTLKERHKATLVSVFVAAEARGHGVGRALVSAAIAHARQRALTLLAVVSAQNAPAKALYRSVGFAAYGTEPRALRIGDGYFDDDLLALDLRPAC